MEKNDVFDLIIETLQQHEKALEELTQRLEFCLTYTNSSENMCKKVQD
jgi:hypothetical protein